MRGVNIAGRLTRVLPCACPRCGGRMIIIEVFARGCEPRYRPTLDQDRPVMTAARIAPRKAARSPSCASSLAQGNGGLGR
jgi:hypothetical protein